MPVPTPAVKTSIEPTIAERKASLIQDILTATVVDPVRFTAGLLKPWPDSDARGLLLNISAALSNVMAPAPTYEYWYNPKLRVEKYSPEEDKKIHASIAQSSKLKQQEVKDVFQGVAEKLEAIYNDYKKNSVTSPSDDEYVVTMDNGVNPSSDDEYVVTMDNPDNLYQIEEDAPEPGIYSIESDSLTLNNQPALPPIVFNPDHLVSVDAIQKKYKEMKDAIEAHHSQIVAKEQPGSSRLEGLNESHAQALAKLEKGMADLISAQHKKAQEDHLRINELHRIYTHNAYMQTKMDKMALLVTASSSEPKALNNLRLKDIESGYTTLTGRMIMKTNNNGSPQYSINFPNRLFTLHPLYYHSVKDNVKSDMLALAECIKVGPPVCDIIEMSVDGKKTPHTLSMARKAYEACLETGFDADKITIRIGTEVIKLNELFPSDIARENAQDRARMYKEQRETSEIGYHIKQLADYKNEFKTVRNTGMALKSAESDAKEDYTVKNTI